MFEIPAISDKPKVWTRLKDTQDGLALYEVKNPTTNMLTKSTVPKENADKYEKCLDDLYTDLDYIENPLKVALKSFKSCFVGALVGGVTSAFLTRKSSTFKKILGSIGGSVVGILGAATVATVVVGKKLVKHINNVKELGMKPYQEQNDNSTSTIDKSENDKSK